MGRDFEMIIAGSGPQEAFLRAYSRKHEFDKNITFLGRVTVFPELLRLYRQADIFILPSIAAEGVPRVIHEAMTQGCPVIATDIGSVKWQLADGAGLVIPPSNTQILTETIINVLDDKQLRQSLSANGFDRSLEFTFEKQGERLATFIKNTVPVGLLA
jgi:glycosyltransferase involved in cell wall biosynthesis